MRYRDIVEGLTGNEALTGYKRVYEKITAHTEFSHSSSVKDIEVTLLYTYRLF
jgi:hypothetical protein